MTTARPQIYDLHTHTTFSDGQMSPEEVWEIARSRGYGVGIADHCGQGDFQLNSSQSLQEYLEHLKRLPVWRAVELDLGNVGAVPPSRLKACDYLIAGLHSLSRSPEQPRLDFFDPGADPGDPRTILERSLQEIEEGARKYRFQILAHPGLLPMALRPQSQRILGPQWEERLIDLAKRYNFALEISSRWELPGRGLIERARSEGVKFSLGSDGHRRETMCCLDYSLAMVKRCGLRPQEMYQAPELATRWTGPIGCVR